MPEFVWKTRTERKNAPRHGAFGNLRSWEDGRQKCLLLSADVRDALIEMDAVRVIFGVTEETAEGKAAFAISPSQNGGEGVKLTKLGGMWGVAAGMLSGYPQGHYIADIGRGVIVFTHVAARLGDAPAANVEDAPAKQIAQGDGPPEVTEIRRAASGKGKSGGTKATPAKAGTKKRASRKAPAAPEAPADESVVNGAPEGQEGDTEALASAVAAVVGE